MFYRPGIDPHGLPHNPFKAMVTPRPIGWISSQDAGGRVNLAPYSFFNALSDDPPMVMFSNTGTKPDQPFAKDSVANIRATGEFVCNIVGLAMKDAMNATSGSYPADVDEFDLAGLEKEPSQLVAPPRVRGVPGALECRLWKIVELPGKANVMVIGEVVGIHIDEAMLRDGIFDVLRFNPLARLGYRDYATVTEVFSLNRPGQS
ncbi:flavin reductase family protein [Halovulum dunhuangense]|uniref:Flavin reductase family protein n=1 Tax=Halovulum dunhuangense TaxID=1505036 RepID=A0A849L0E3_9RHOB|nr:flavin reductase family protein [Halovulum dunhuangense]NNU79738.1 flavin reductase family protein [Halovulum dunhuangense]